MKLTKQEDLDKIEELKKYVKDEDVKESSKIKLQIKTIAGEVLYESEKTTIKEAVVEAVSKGDNLSFANLRSADLSFADLRGANLSFANLRGADLRGADLSGANLRGADLRGAYLRGANLGDANLGDVDLFNTKFYGRGGSTKIKKSQINDFFKALGIVVED